MNSRDISRKSRRMIGAENRIAGICVLRLIWFNWDVFSAGSKLDAALAKLYSWCSANNVPIMAHTSHSFGPNTDYDDRADPIFWAAVLKQDAFSRLRINLAHFGHFNNAVQHARPQDHVDKCWEWTIGKILTSSAEAYADISSLGEILKTGPS